MPNRSTQLSPELSKLRDEILGYAQGFGLDCFNTIFEMVPSDAINSLAAQEGFPVRYTPRVMNGDYPRFMKW